MKPKELKQMSDQREAVAQLKFMSANLRNLGTGADDFAVMYHERVSVADNIDAILSALALPSLPDSGSLRPSAFVPTASGDGPAAHFSEDAIRQMVERFLGWRLPETFNPDGGVRFDKTNLHPQHWPSGTNLLDWRQAEAMVRHMLEGLGQ